MKVKKIHIENYRMLKRIDIDLEENLSLIIGKNNCGKTSFLSILNKFIGSQSSTNNFTYNDFNSDFQDSLFDAINDDQLSWEKLNIKGIELYLFIEYDETDNLSNIQPLMLDLDPDNNIVILKFEYTISEQKFIKVFVLLMTNFRNLLIITNICIGVFRILHLWKSRISTNILKGICRFLPSTK